MKRKSKGISPLVAVIMLIAFTMIVAGILAGWATRFATEQRGVLEKCVRASVVIQRANYDVASGNVTLMLYNSGTVPLEDFNVLISYKNSTEVPDTTVLDMSLPENSFAETGQINNTYTDIDYVQITSRECQGAQDMIRSYSISNLPLN